MQRNPKLTHYAAAAGAFVLMAQNAEAQVLYSDIDPDAYIHEDGMIPVDLDMDGAAEIDFHGFQYITDSSGGTSSGMFDSYQQFYLQVLASVAFTAGVGYGPRIDALALGDTVGDQLDFTNGGALNIMNALRFGEYWDTGMSSNQTFYSGGDILNQDVYVGARFLIGGATHYGWVRIELKDLDYPPLPELIIKDYAYNAVADEPLVIGTIAAGEINAPVLSDVSDTDTPADLQLTFTKAEDESTISEYRVMLLPVAADPLSVAEANALPSDRYTVVLPTGSDIVMNFNATTKDIDGDLLAPDVLYRAQILSVADGLVAIANSVSIASNYEAYELTPASPAISVTLTDILDNTDITDLAFSFTPEPGEFGVGEYRIFIADTLGLSIDTLLSLDAAYYQTVSPSGAAVYLNYYTTDKRIIGTEMPYLFDKYYPIVVSMPDMVNALVPSQEAPTTATYFYYPVYDETPLVTVDGTSGDPSDVRVQFSPMNNEPNLHDYRIVIVKEADAGAFEPNDIAGLPAPRMLLINPTGSDIDTHLEADMRDIDGDFIEPGVPYRIFVVLTPDYYALDFARMQVSDMFQLTEPLSVNNELNSVHLFAENNFLHIEGEFATTVITIYNPMGAAVWQQSVNGSEVLDLHHLPAGNYFAVAGDPENQFHLSFNISK